MFKFSIFWHPVSAFIFKMLNVVCTVESIIDEAFNSGINYLENHFSSVLLNKQSSTTLNLQP